MEAFLRQKGVTQCPGMGTPELAALHKKRHEEWLNSVGEHHKKALGFIPSDKRRIYSEETPSQKRQRMADYQRERRKKQAERNSLKLSTHH